MTQEVSVFILGSGEIARCLARLASTAGYKVGISDLNVDQWEWSPSTELYKNKYVDQPWELPPSTHAIIARGHDGDAESLACLLNQGADRVYLIASARRAQGVIEEARANLKESQLNNLSAPAGLELGGNSSMEIALSILAEIQMRHYQTSGKALTDLRHKRRADSQSGRQHPECPGKRV